MKCSGALATNGGRMLLDSPMLSPSIAANGAVPVHLASPDWLVGTGSDELSDEAKQILGKTAVSRLEAFRKYRANWNGTEALPLSRHSISSLDAFLRMQRTFSTPPSLFLNEGGNLVLGWENWQGQSIEAEFDAERWTIYFADDDEKIFVPISPYSWGMISHRLS
jgi:hypothetical protein